MKGLLERSPLTFTIFLSFTLAITTPRACAQSADDKVAPQAPQTVQSPATNSEPSTENTPGNSVQPSSAVPGPDYILGPEDVIEIDVFDVPELSKKTVRIANDGQISLPLIGRVQAAGLTPEQLRHALQDKWGEDYLQNPQVTIFVKEFKAKPVSVIGAVEKPGLYPLTARRTLIEMLSTAGGLGTKLTTPAGRMVLITRKGGFKDLQLAPGMHERGPDQIEIDLNRLLYTRDEALNIEIKPQDVIAVSRADIVYVTGAVKKPGAFVLESHPTVTVMQAIAMAEGFTGTAAKKSARILRTDPDGTKTDVPVNLGKIFKGKVEDVTLAANDVLYVPDSKSKMAGSRAIDASITTFSGWLIWAH